MSTFVVVDNLAGLLLFRALLFDILFMGIIAVERHNILSRVVPIILEHTLLLDELALSQSNSETEPNSDDRQ